MGNGMASPRGVSIEPAGWPVLDITLARSQLPAPPLDLADIFPAPWAEWIGSAAEASGAPADYVALPLLAAAGALIGNARWVNPWNEWREPPALFVALIGLPSAGKSPALDTVMRPLSGIEADANTDMPERRREWDTAKEGAEARRDRWKGEVKTATKMGNPPPQRPIDAAEPAMPQRRRVFSTDPTPEKAARMSAANPRGLLLNRDELAGWMASMDRYSGGGDRAFWLESYGGRAWAPDRVKDGDAEVSVPHLLWGIAGGIQPDRMASVLLAGDDDGMAARFLYTWPERRKPFRPGPTPDLHKAQTWLARLHALPWTPTAPILVPFAEEARHRLQGWRDEIPELEADAAGLFLSWLGKTPGFVVRVALILEHLAWAAGPDGAPPPQEVSLHSFEAALAFVKEYALPMAQRAFGEASRPQEERGARQIARWLLRQKPLPSIINGRELRRVAGGPTIPNAAQMKAALEELAEAGWVQPRRQTGAGRKADDWTVNPALAPLARRQG